MQACRKDTISGNTVSRNQWGITSWYGCTITGNTSSWDMYGITVTGDGNLVKGNTVLSSAQNGIDVQGAYNVIEANVASYCTVGINFSNAQNVYADNRAMNNKTNFGGSVPTGSRNGGGNIGFGTLAGSTGGGLQRGARQAARDASESQ